MQSSSSIRIKAFNDACLATRILSRDGINSRRESARTTRNYKLVCCSSSSSSEKGSTLNSSGNAGAFLFMGQSYALLKQQMEVAAKSENYEEAARIRDSLKLLEEEKPVLQLRILIKEAVAEERFEECYVISKY